MWHQPIDALINNVITGDCVTLMENLPPGSVDLIVTDPPYLTKYKDRKGRSFANDDNDRWLTGAYRQMYRVLKGHTFCVSFYGWSKAERFIRAWRAAGFSPVGHLIFVKGYRSHREPRFVAFHHEQAYLLVKGDPKPREILGDVMEFKYTGNKYHPSQKPIEALEPLIRAYSDPDDVVLDPFCGSGATLLAAKKLRRRYIGYELVDNYARGARFRLDRAR